MVKGFWWVFAAYSVVWLALFGYVMQLLKAQRRLEKSVRELESGK